MFKVGDLIVYGSMGVCRVADISTPDMPGARECYVLQPTYFPETKVYAPVENNPVVVRPVMSRAEGDALIDSMPGLELFGEESKMDTAKTYRTVLQSADGHRVARLVKTLYSKRRRLLEAKKSFSSADKDTLNSAETVLHGELAHVLKIEIGQVPAYINARLGDLDATA